MEEKTASRTLSTLTGCVVMLAVTLFLPLVNLKSYRFTFVELPHKIERLVQGTGSQAVGYVLVAALLLAPLVLLLQVCMGRRGSSVLLVLPLLIAALFVMVLLAGKPSPGIGLWIYLAVAAAVAFLGLKKRV